jgi:hypothetical protein
VPRTGIVTGVAALAAAPFLFAAPIAAQTPAAPEAPPPRLAFPVDCTLGKDCFVQNYVDRDPGPGFLDFACGPLGYDGHRGTDIALPDLAAMRRGVAVRAAAAGLVRATRDGMADSHDPAEALHVPSDRACGNGVVIDHGEGWETQYCHLANGSVAVRAGDRVAAGDTIGRVGMSGRAEFPHLHISLRHDGAPVDPFRPGAFSPDRCAPPEGATPSLWLEPFPYRPGGFVSAGFADRVPEFMEIKEGTAAAASLAARAPALVFWVHLFGVRAGDRLELSLTGPEGQTLVVQSFALDRTQARLFRASGRRAPPQGWAAGSYRGTAALWRGDQVIDRMEAAVAVR